MGQNQQTTRQINGRYLASLFIEEEDILQISLSLRVCERILMQYNLEQIVGVDHKLKQCETENTWSMK